jgi:hypothetical protein
MNILTILYMKFYSFQTKRKQLLQDKVLIEKAKEKLSTTQLSVSEIA